jgi:hypothetical protein|tara:strand:- start:5268 stop:5522 length:255 start_codon:yes stop_codon:yes gene_type:complete
MSQQAFTKVKYQNRKEKIRKIVYLKAGATASFTAKYKKNSAQHTPQKAQIRIQLTHHQPSFAHNTCSYYTTSLTTEERLEPCGT